MAVPAYALLDDNSTNQQQQQGQISDNDNRNTNTNLNGNDNDNRNTNLNANSQGQGQGQDQGQLQGQAQGQGQMQGQAAIAAQGQVQGQASIQGNQQNTSEENKTYANAWPSVTGGEGVSQANAYSIFGGLGLSSTEPYKKYIVQIQAIEASQTLTSEEKKVLVEKLVNKMIDSNKTQRLLAIGPETSGRNLLNLFGLLSIDSFWKEGQKPFSSSKSAVVEAELDKVETAEGNKGYVVK